MKTEEDLIKEAQEGSDAAFTLLVKRYEKVIWDRCNSILHDYHDAREAQQDTILRMWKYLKSYEKQKDKEFGYWVEAIARRCSLSVIHGKGKDLDIDEVEHLLVEPETPETIFGRKEAEQAAIDQMVALLTPKQYAALYSTVFENKTTREIAEELDCSANAVYLLVKKARAILKEEGTLYEMLKV